MAEATSTAGPSVVKATKTKLGGYDFYKSIGSPKWVVAPMVDQSELAWRMLSRSPLPPSMAGRSTDGSHPGGATLCYTPMMHAKIFRDSKQASRGGDGQFDLTSGEEGSYDPVAGIEGGDRPLFAQFCANDPETLLEAAKKIQHQCDAIDINFGCPQGIARKGHYGAFLQDDWELIKRLIGILHENLDIPVTAKFRIFPDKERTIAYARMIEAAGAQIITCHGRTREMKGQLTGLADWEMIKAVKQAVKVPVFANGNILYREDVDRCLEITGCDGVMTAEGNLSNPAIFLPQDYPYSHPSIIVLADRYLDIVAALKTVTATSAIRAHLFRLFKPILDQDKSVLENTEDNLRIMIAKARLPAEGGVDEFRAVVREVERRIQPDVDAAGPSWRAPPIDPSTGYRDLPYWVAQPLLRPKEQLSGSGETGDSVGKDIAVDGSATPTEQSQSQTNVSSKCVFSGPSVCHSIAAMRCPTKACLIHCRQIRAIAHGMDPEEAAKKAITGQLAGQGCEAHEAKVAARKDRLAVKRKDQVEGKKLSKIRKKESKQMEKAREVMETA